MSDTLTTQAATPATVPASTVIATDDAGAGGHVQIVKLAISTDGSATAIPADASNGIDVDVTRLPALVAGTANIGDVDVLTIAEGDNNIGNVDIVTMPAVTNGGTFAVQESGAALTALQLIDDTVYTDGTGTPSKAIGVAGTDGTNPQIIKTDAAGELQVDVLTMPTVAVTQSGTWDEVGIHDSGNSITVDNGGTFATQAAQSGTWNITNVSGTVSLPTGASTSVKQDTVIGHLDGVETLLGTIDADTGNISTKIDTLAGAVSGSEMQVDVLTMPTVTVNSHAVTNAGVFAVQVDGAALTSLQLADDVVATLGTDTYTEATTKANIIGAVRRDADTTLVNTTNEIAPLQVDANGRLKVEAFSGETLPVSLTSTTITGTVAATQSGTWDEVGIHDSGNSITVDNGGTFAVQVDGNALTALQLIDDTVAVLGTATYTEATTKGNVIAAVRRDADTTLADTTNEIAPLQVDARGALKVEVFSGETLPVSLTSTTVTGTVAVTQSGTWDEVGINDSGNSITVDNGGTFVVQENGAALTALQVIDNPVIVDDAAFTPATTSVMMAGYEADESSTDSVDEGDGGAARMTLDRKQIVTVQGHTQGGLSTFMASGSDGSNILVATAQAIKASAGQLYGYYAYNPESAATFVHFYNTASASVTVGTTNPMFTIAIPAGSAANLTIPQGILFSNAGWSCAATTTAGGTGAPATGVSLVVWYM